VITTVAVPVVTAEKRIEETANTIRYSSKDTTDTIRDATNDATSDNADGGLNSITSGDAAAGNDLSADVSQDATNSSDNSATATGGRATTTSSAGGASADVHSPLVRPGDPYLCRAADRVRAGWRIRSQ